MEPRKVGQAPGNDQFVSLDGLADMMEDCPRSDQALASAGSAVPSSPGAPQAQVMRSRTLYLTSPFNPQNGLLSGRDEMVVALPDGEPIRVVKEFRAMLDDGRVAMGYGDFNRDPETGLTFTNASAVGCASCGRKVFARTLRPSKVKPDRMVCSDCARRGV